MYVIYSEIEIVTMVSKQKPLEHSFLCATGGNGIASKCYEAGHIAVRIQKNIKNRSALLHIE